MDTTNKSTTTDKSTATTTTTTTVTNNNTEDDNPFPRALQLLQQKHNNNNSNGEPLSKDQTILLQKFIETRNGDVNSAVERYEKHIQLVKDFDLSMRLSVDLLDAMKMGIIFQGGLDKESRPSLLLAPGSVDWNKVTIIQMRKLWYFQIMRVIMKTPTAQTKGLNLVINGSGVSMATVKREFLSFVGKAVNECMPTKIHRIYFANEPWIFSTILWPIVSFFLKEKLRQRVRVIGKRYEELLEQFKPEDLPTGIGGTRELNGEEEANQCCKEFEFEG
jgi:hypothetical protein